MEIAEVLLGRQHHDIEAEPPHRPAQGPVVVRQPRRGGLVVRLQEGVAVAVVRAQDRLAGRQAADTAGNRQGRQGQTGPAPPRFTPREKPYP